MKSSMLKKLKKIKWNKNTTYLWYLNLVINCTDALVIGIDRDTVQLHRDPFVDCSAEISATQTITQVSLDSFLFFNIPNFAYGRWAMKFIL